jgi:hypothetical protein
MLVTWSYTPLTGRCLAGSTAGTSGPAEAFTRGKEAAVRRDLFGKIAPVYDQVGCSYAVFQAMAPAYERCKLHSLRNVSAQNMVTRVLFCS